jgi:hypothetical protein
LCEAKEQQLGLHGTGNAYITVVGCGALAVTLMIGHAKLRLLILLS